MIRKVVLFWAIIHLLTIIVITLLTMVGGYKSFYYSDSQKKESSIETVLSGVVHSNVVRSYTTLSGINTGYGFFAPNVASEVFTEFILFNKDSVPVKQIYSPKFYHNESWHKYSTMLGTYLDEVFNRDTSKAISLIQKLRTDNIVNKVFQDYPEAKTINGKVYIFKYPSLKDVAKGNNEPLKIKIDEVTLSRIKP